MQPQRSAPHRVARLGLAALLGILLGFVLLGSALSGALAPNVPAWWFGAPLLSVLFLPPALSLWLDARLRRSWHGLLRAFSGLALVGVGMIGVNFIATANSTQLTHPTSPAALAIYAVYLLGAPLILTAGPAFTVGGLGGNMSSWAYTAAWAGVLAWVSAGMVVLPAAYVWTFVLHPCHSSENVLRGGSFCVGPAITIFLLFTFVLGLVVAPFGGLVGGALRTRVGQGIRSV